MKFSEDSKQVLKAAKPIEPAQLYSYDKDRTARPLNNMISAEDYTAFTATAGGMMKVGPKPGLRVEGIHRVPITSTNQRAAARGGTQFIGNNVGPSRRPERMSVPKSHKQLPNLQGRYQHIGLILPTLSVPKQPLSIRHIKSIDPGLTKSDFKHNNLLSSSYLPQQFASKNTSKKAKSNLRQKKLISLEPGKLNPSHFP